MRKGTNPHRGSDFQTHLLKNLKDPEFAADYIMLAIEENDESYLAHALSMVVKAHGVSKVAKASHLSRQALYKMFSNKGNPSLHSLNSILDAVGLRLAIEPKTVETKKKRSA